MENNENQQIHSATASQNKQYKIEISYFHLITNYAFKKGIRHFLIPLIQSHRYRP